MQLCSALEAAEADREDLQQRLSMAQAATPNRSTLMAAADGSPEQHNTGLLQRLSGTAATSAVSALHPDIKDQTLAQSKSSRD